MAHVINIENLHQNVDVPALCEHFKNFGRIIDAGIETDKNYHSLGKAYITYDNGRSCIQASHKMNKMLVFGRHIKVRAPEGQKSYYTKVFVKNFSENWDEMDIDLHFSKFGDITETIISRNDTKSNGYGFVKFRKHESAKKAVESLNEKEFEGLKLTVKPFQPREKRNTADTLEEAEQLLNKSTDQNNLHVKNVPKEMLDYEFEELFQKFGNIISAKISRDDRQQSKGFGFVCFTKPEEAKRAKSHMDGYSINNNILEVNFHQKKAAREQYMRLRSNSRGRQVPSSMHVPVKISQNNPKGNNTLFHFSSRK